MFTIRYTCDIDFGLSHHVPLVLSNIYIRMECTLLKNGGQLDMFDERVMNLMANLMVGDRYENA